jgi:hypothetical protein
MERTVEKTHSPDLRVLGCFSENSSGRGGARRRGCNARAGASVPAPRGRSGGTVLAWAGRFAVPTPARSHHDPRIRRRLTPAPPSPRCACAPTPPVATSASRATGP